MTESRKIDTILVNRAVVRHRLKYFLILRRSSANKTKVGEWEFTGGKSKPNEDTLEALRRECMDETNLEISVVRLWIGIESRKILDGDYEGYRYVSHFHLVESDTSEVTLSAEHDDYAWVTIEEMLEYPLRDDVRKVASSLLRN